MAYLTNMPGALSSRATKGEREKRGVRSRSCGMTPRFLCSSFLTPGMSPQAVEHSTQHTIRSLLFLPRCSTGRQLSLLAQTCLSMQHLTTPELTVWIEHAARETLVLLDVREPWTFQACHIDGALTMTMNTIPSKLSELDAEQAQSLQPFYGHLYTIRVRPYAPQGDADPQRATAARAESSARRGANFATQSNQ